MLSVRVQGRCKTFPISECMDLSPLCGSLAAVFEISDLNWLCVFCDNGFGLHGEWKAFVVVGSSYLISVESLPDSDIHSRGFSFI